MKSRFTIPLGNPSSPLTPVDFAPTPIQRKAVTRPQVVTYLNSHPATARHAAKTRLMKQLGSGLHTQGFLTAPPIRKTDPYFLLLLAERELHEGHNEQAEYLVESAYVAYDQRIEPCSYKIRPVV